MKKPNKTARTEDALLEERLQAHVNLGVEKGLAKDQQERFLRAGVILQGRQMEFCAAARECDYGDGPTAVGYGGGRGSAKSHGVFAQMAVDDCQRVNQLKCLYLRKIGKTNREQFDDIRRKVLARVPHSYAEQKGMLTIESSGSQIRVGHFKDEKDIDAYLGVEYDLITIEETTQLSFTKWKNILSCLRTSKDNWRPRVYCPTNPGGVGHGWYKTIFVEPWRRRAQRDTRYIHTTVHDNRHVNKEYLGYLESLTGWQREAWLNGSWDIAAGQFFINFRPAVHVLERMDTSAARKWISSFDYGFSHWSVFLLAYLDDAGRIMIVDECADRLRVPQEIARQYYSMLARNQLHPGHITHIAAGPDVFSRESDGTTIADQYRNLGINLSCGKIDRINGWSEMLRRLGDPDNGVKPTTFIHRRCERLIEQIPLMLHDPKRPEDVEKVDCDPEDGSGGDDFCDAARLLYSTNPSLGVVNWLQAVNVGGYVAIGG